MSRAKPKVVIVPCSGIGKPYGTVSRETAFIVTEELSPDKTQLVPLSLLVLGDPQTRATVTENVAVTIDGCKLACSTKMVKESGGTVAKDIAVLDVFRQHRDLKPLGIAELNPEGLKLARVIAEEITRQVDDLTAVVPDSPNPRKAVRKHA